MVAAVLHQIGDVQNQTQVGRISCLCSESTAVPFGIHNMTFSYTLNKKTDRIKD